MRFKGFEYKKCPFCGLKQVKKDGWQKGKQRYKCHRCFKRFCGGIKLNPEQLWQEYSVGKQTVSQLAQRFHCSTKTISRYLKKATKKNHFASPDAVNLIIDTTYFGRQYGVLVLYDSVHKEALSVVEVKYETNALYLAAVNEIKVKGVKVQSVICDGRKGLIRHFFPTPVQLCQFHQVATINRYLTRKPKSFAGQELRALVLTLKESTKVAFETTLDIWFERHKTYLNERTISQKTGKLIYTHQRLRSAYSSLKNNLNYLFTFEDYPELNIPKTTNLLESTFGDMKQKLRCHQGLMRDNKILFIKDYFSLKSTE